MQMVGTSQSPLFSLIMAFLLCSISFGLLSIRHWRKLVCVTRCGGIHFFLNGAVLWTASWASAQSNFCIWANESSRHISHIWYLTLKTLGTYHKFVRTWCQFLTPVWPPVKPSSFDVSLLNLHWRDLRSKKKSCSLFSWLLIERASTETIWIWQDCFIYFWSFRALLKLVWPFLIQMCWNFNLLYSFKLWRQMTSYSL